MNNISYRQSDFQDYMEEENTYTIKFRHNMNIVNMDTSDTTRGDIAGLVNSAKFENLYTPIRPNHFSRSLGGMDMETHMKHFVTILRRYPKVVKAEYKIISDAETEITFKVNP